MNVITIEDLAFAKIMSKIDSLEKTFAEIVRQAKNPLKDKWLDKQDVMDILKCSPKQLQLLRSRKKIPFSMIGQKIYFKAADIEKYIESNYNQLKNF